ncbi:hypothetical protein [Nostoc sp. WHI]|uniref:hypothetical protein n=1 Tax=Nostoc sp. WHI TaxID=2650611 RepID=UPI0018C5A6C6|nr:hypothetical protein [Nostoc sp. WHI]MBG1270816.1 hypothetical protein [Nostoc sp. WHI]
MSKPLGFFTSTMPGDGSYLDEMQSVYGSTFEKLGRTEKLLVLESVVKNLIVAETAAHGINSTAQAMAHASSITPGIRESVGIDEHLGLAEALINQLKYQH